MLIIANQLFIFRFFQILDVLKVDRVCHAKLPRRRNLCVKDAETNSSIIFLKPQDRRSAARAVLSRPDLQELFPFLEAHL